MKTIEVTKLGVPTGFEIHVIDNPDVLRALSFGTGLCTRRELPSKIYGRPESPCHLVTYRGKKIALIHMDSQQFCDMNNRKISWWMLRKMRKSGVLIRLTIAKALESSSPPFFWNQIGKVEKWKETVMHIDPDYFGTEVE